MNEKNNLSIFVFLFVVGIIFGVIVTDRYYNSKIDGLSSTISAGKEINARLRLSNTYLSGINNELTKKVGELEKRIVNDYREYKERLEKIAGGLGEISTGLGERGSDIQSIIDGMEDIKKGLRKIETIK